MPRIFWLDRQAYPFRSRYCALPAGKLHYVDEGSGPPVVMVHGAPAWSFLYRELIQGLRGEFRCIAPDLLGFGLSEKPRDWTYRAQDQAAVLGQFLDALGLDGFALVAHDWGGPIGLAAALDRPGALRHVVLMNTWLWPMADNPAVEQLVTLYRSGFYRFLVRRFNASLKRLGHTPIEGAVADNTVHKQYLHPLRNPAERRGLETLADDLLEAGDWLDGLWGRREALHSVPALLVWGLRDPVCGPAALERWCTVFDHAAIARYPHAGHFVPEEAGAVLCPRVAAHLAGGGSGGE